MIYPVVVHWVWNREGFLHRLGFHDFSGDLPVHVIGGLVGLIATMRLGSRIGKFNGKSNVKF